MSASPPGNWPCAPPRTRAKRCGRQARESPSDLFPSPRGDGVAAFIEFDVVNEGLDRFTRLATLFYSLREDSASFVAPAELGDEAVPDIALFVGARGAVGVCPVQDGFVWLAGERAFFYLRIGDAEETAAAPVERELVLAEILRVIRRELTGGVQANLVQHPPEIDQTSDFVVATAQAWNVLHKRNMNRKQVLVTFLQMPSLALRDRASSSATPRASPVAARPDLSPIRRR